MLLSLVAAMPLLLIGCTASWQAPVESRTNQPYSAPPIQAVRDRDNYQVKPGDTLYGIAWSAGVDYRLLAAWNRLSPPYRIYAGQRLRLKPPPARQAQPGLASTSPGTASSRPVPPRPAVPQRPRPEPPAAASPSTPPAPRPVPTPPRTTETRPPAGPQELRWIWPTDGPLLARFDAAAPLGRGIKVGGRRGQSIRAAERGKVVYSGSGLIGYGRLIIVKHNDKFLSAYGHNEDIRVAEGDQVTKGQEIATMGVANAGKPLLHFEIRRDGKPVDPTGYLPKR